MLSYTYANKLLKEISGIDGGSYNSSVTYIGLSKTKPERDGTNITEPDTDAGYRRVIMGSSDRSSKMAQPNDGEIQNSDIIYFPEATAAWGNCTHYVIFSAQTGGTFIAYGQLTQPISPTTGTVPLIRTGELQMTLT